MKGKSIESRVGTRVSECRRTAGLTQEKLAEQVNVTPGTISRLERGENIPSIKALGKIAEVLALDLHDLFNFTNKRTARDEVLEEVIYSLKQRNTEELILIRDLIWRAFQTELHQKRKD